MTKNIPILYYHFVKQPPKDARIKGLFTNPFQFEWQIRKLVKNKFTFITFEDIAAGNYDESKKNIIITFDDGCESVYFNAFPILKKYNAKAVFYIVADAIGDKNVVWEQNENRVPMNIVTVDQIREMKQYGIEIGSHLCNHVHLTSLGEDEMLNELTVSKNKLEKFINDKIYSVAYPFGSYNREVIETARKAGYEFGVITKAGINDKIDNLELFRFAVKGYALRHYFYFLKTMRLIQYDYPIKKE